VFRVGETALSGGAIFNIVWAPFLQVGRVFRANNVKGGSSREARWETAHLEVGSAHPVGGFGIRYLVSGIWVGGWKIRNSKFRGVGVLCTFASLRLCVKDRSGIWHPAVGWVGGKFEIRNSKFRGCGWVGFTPSGPCAHSARSASRDSVTPAADWPSPGGRVSA